MRWHEFRERWDGFMLFMSAFLAALVIFLCWGLFMAYRDSQSEKIELTKAEWTCTARGPSVMVMVGNVLVPFSDCVTYRRVDEHRR